MLPIVAVQVAPADAHAMTPALEAQLLGACSAGLERARCVATQNLEGAVPRGIATVSWTGAEEVSIEVGLADDASTGWLSRALRFVPTDPEPERWRAIGFTIALLADDPRFWAEPEAQAPAVNGPSELERDTPPAPTQEPRWAVHDYSIEGRAFTGTGLLSGAWRWGAELRLVVPISGSLVATGSANYALAERDSLNMRWFDATAGLGWRTSSFIPRVEARVRLEALGEHIAAQVERGNLIAQNSAWVPGVLIGGDLLHTIGSAWQASVRADFFWLDGATGIRAAGERLGASAGAGMLVGLGAGYCF